METFSIIFIISLTLGLLCLFLSLMFSFIKIGIFKFISTYVSRVGYFFCILSIIFYLLHLNQIPDAKDLEEGKAVYVETYEIYNNDTIKVGKLVWRH